MVIVSGFTGFSALVTVLGLVASGEVVGIIHGDTTPHEEECK